MTTRHAKTATVKIATHRRIAKPSLGFTSAPVPKLPHEQDESADSQASEPRKVIQDAATDLKRGQTDTDRGVEMNQVYRRLKVSR